MEQGKSSSRGKAAEILGKASLAPRKRVAQQLDGPRVARGGAADPAEKARRGQGHLQGTQEEEKTEVQLAEEAE